MYKLLLILGFMWAAPLTMGQGSSVFTPFSTGEGLNIRPQDVIVWQGAGATRYSNGYLVLSLRLQTFQGFSVYTHNLKFETPAGLPVEVLRAPPPEEVPDPLSDTGKKTGVYTAGDFELGVQASPTDTAANFMIHVRSVGCASICLHPYTQEISLPVLSKAEAFTPAPRGHSNGVSPQDAAIPSSLTKALSLDAQETDQLLRSGAWGWLLLLLFLGGLFTNLTPCVYPMIPITIGLLGQHKTKKKSSALLAGFSYAAGIVATYTSLALVTAWTGGLFGQFMAHPAVNLAFALLMIGIACSMLGYGHWNRTQAFGFKFQHSRHWILNAFVLGIGAGFVAAPCTGPILAALLTYTATSGHPWRASLFRLVYSIGFALPYVALAEATQAIKKVKLPRHFDHTVKVGFASIMLALGWYYLRVPFYTTFKSLQHSWGQIGLVAFALGVCLIVWQRVTSRTQQRRSSLAVSLCLSLALFAGFERVTHPTVQTESGVQWNLEEVQAFATAIEEKKPLLIDMWAEWCEACKKMDTTTLADPEVQKALQAWTLLKLDLTEDTEENEARLQKYRAPGLPTLLLIVDPTHPENAVRITGYTDAKTLLQELNQHR